MQTLTALPSTAKTTTLEIKAANYLVEPIDPGFAGDVAIRLTKLVTGDIYDVVRGYDGVVSCDCPDFICRHEGKGTVRKHGAAMVARGFLPAAEAPAPFAPITRKDLARAAMFRIKLPADAPRTVEAPAARPLDLTSLVVVISGPAEVVAGPPILPALRRRPRRRLPVPGLRRRAARPRGVVIPHRPAGCSRNRDAP